MRERLLELAEASSGLRRWIEEQAPRLGTTFPVKRLCDLPDVLAREASRRCLVERGAEAKDLVPDVLDRLVTMARDAATPAKCDFAGGVRVRRRQGIIFAEGEDAE